jgi:hypothetical protein
MRRAQGPKPRPVDAPKGFDGQVLRGARIAHDAHDPAVDLALELTEQRLKGFRVAARELFEQFHIRSCC